MSDRDDRHEGIKALDDLAGFRVSEGWVFLSNVVVAGLAVLIFWLVGGGSERSYGIVLTASMGVWSFVLLPVALSMARRRRGRRTRGLPDS